MDGIAVDKVGATTILRLARDYGSCQNDALQELSKALGEVARDFACRVVLDLAKVTYVGARFLGTLAKGQAKIKARLGRLAFCRVPLHFQELFQVSGLSCVGPIFATREEAVHALEGVPSPTGTTK
jgi:anti-anti-sigma factor